MYDPHSFLAILEDLPSPKICVKIQPQGIFVSGEEHFKGFYVNIGMVAILVNGPQQF